MSTQVLFPTLVYEARLRLPGWRQLNTRLLRECRQLRADDAAGRRWSARHYPGGYTSYNSAHRMHRLSPTFASLARELDRHVAKFARRLQLDLAARALTMTDCWVSLMGRGAVHGLHLHPLSTISGTYYVAVPAGSPGLKFEDPRLERFMASPPRLSGARRTNRPWVTFSARAGQLMLFESWLRHEVTPNPGAAERVSISFNYSWF
ncbi:MAG TPA: TIGR02466 family protein [Steroidobacteraceae bacterium]